MNGDNSKQLILPLIKGENNFESYFISKNNRELIFSIKENIKQGHGNIFFWGNDGCGKTHLLEAACSFAKQHDKSCYYLDLSTKLPPGILENLENYDLVCLDNIDAVAKNEQWEHALFVFYNKSITSNTILIISATNPIADIGFALADLVSRFQWGLNFKLKKLNQDDLLSVLQLRFKLRGLNLKTKAGMFLLNREERSLKKLMQNVEILDTASLVHGNKITISFIKKILKV